MTAPEIPARPALVTVPNVELIKTGTWNISTGTWKPTAADLESAIAATSAPGFRRPVLKLGHIDERFDGEPAMGWIDNLRTTDNGETLVGDYVGVPSWLADVMASAYPDRSIEGASNAPDAEGTVHPFVLSAVALLGVTPPGVTTLSSLQDVAKLYGVMASGEGVDTFKVEINAKGAPVAQSVKVAASISTEDIRLDWYAANPDREWWWIRDIMVDPTEVIVVDDETGSMFRVPFTVDEATGAVTWGTEQEVKVEYVTASASLRTPAATWDNHTESRHLASDATEVPPAPAPDVEDPEEGEGAMAFELDEAQQTRILEALGLDAATEDGEAVVAALEALAQPAEEDSGAPAVAASQAIKIVEASGQVVVEAGVLETLKIQAARGEQARTEQEDQARMTLVSAAIGDGRIAPSRKEHWVASLKADPGMAEVLASLKPGLVPVDGEIGHGQNVLASADSEQDLGWF